MTHIDPDTGRTVYTTPAAAAEIRREVGRENRTAWWVAGIVAVAAIIAVAFMITRPTGPTNDQLTAAAQQGHAMGVIEGAQTVGAQSSLAASQAAANAQAAAAQAEAASRAAADQTAAAAERAAADAQQAAASAADSASDASGVVIEQPQADY